MTRLDLADMLDLTEKHIEKVECGTRRFSITAFVEFAEAFDVSLDYLIFGTESREIKNKEIIRYHLNSIYELIKNDKSE